MTMGKKLDLSKLTDEEAKHVWDVIHRDFDLRKKEEDRLGDLKTKIEKEDTKRELLGTETSLTESYCIRCLKPFKFLVNNKRQCLDCHMHICKSCSHYNKKEQGWVCDPCHMSRVLKIGTLEWYHENVRARFKRFGSAKVMRSLFKRLNGEPSGSESELREPSDFDTQSMSDVHTGAYEDTSIDPTDSQNYKATHSPNDTVTEPGNRESDLSEAHTASVFHQICDEQHKRLEYTDGGLDFSQGLESGISQHQDELVYSENRAPSRSMSRLSYSSCGSGSAGGPRGSSIYLPGPDDSEEDEHFHHFPLYQSHQAFYSHTSQESLNSSNPNQITDIHRRMSAIETLLNRIEQKVTTTDQAPTPDSVSPVPQSEADLEEQQLRQKLHELTDNISDHSISSDEDESGRPQSSQEPPVWRSPLQGDAFTSKIPTRPSSRQSSVASRSEERTLQQAEALKINQSTESLESGKLHPAEGEAKAKLRGSTALLFELEDKVAQAAADVQNTQSQVSYIENRIAALNAAGMPVDKRRKSAIPIQARRLSQNFPTNQVDRFVRNSFYTGSLTQRNPVVKPQTKAPCAKPVMTQGS